MDGKDAHSPYRIFIIDDHPVLRDGIASLINNQEDMEVVGEAETAQEAMRKLANLDADLATVDISLKGMDGIELIRNIKAMRDDIALLVLSAHDENMYAERAIRAGALGYVMKSHDQGKLIEAIHQVLKGQVFVGAEIMTRMMGSGKTGRDESAHGPERLLTDRELEVLKEIGNGKTTAEIAASLGMSAKTVQRHRDNIRGKLKIPNNTHLQFFAFKYVQENP